LLACPNCAGELDLDVAAQAGDEIVEGSLSCGSCRTRFPIARGIPRFVGDGIDRTAANFGTQWTIFSEDHALYDRQLRNWIAPVEPAGVNGATVLEVGCGKGRHTKLLADWGATVVAVDAGPAVEVAYARVAGRPNAHVVQADALRLPLRPVFDLGIAI